MKKDLHIAKVTYLQLVLVHEFNPDFRGYDWNVYLVNKNIEPLEMVFIVIEGKEATRKTALTRHKIENFPAQSVAKIEYMPDELLVLNNSFVVSFFCRGKLFEKRFLIKKNTITELKAEALSLFDGQKGFVFE